MRSRSTIVIGFVLLLGFAGLVPGLMTSSTAQMSISPCLETEYGTWCGQTVLNDVKKFDGIAIGDADNDGINDIVGVGLSGKVMMASKIGGEWQTRTVWESPGELIIPAIGDADNDGLNEIVVVGMVAGPEADTGAGQVAIIEGAGNYWTATRIHTDSLMIHGVAIGDIDPDHPGNEIVTGGFDHNMTLIWGSGSSWQYERMMTAEHKIRTVVIGDVDGDGAGEVVAASKDNKVYLVEKDGASWKHQVVFTDPDAGEARCAFGDYTGNGNMDIVAGGDSSQLALATRSGDTWSGNIVWKDSDKLRGTWIGDVYDGRVGNEIITAGYSGNVTMHFQESDVWKHTLVYHTDNRLHHVLIGEVDIDHPGLEIITTGYSNRVTVIAQYHPDFEMEMTPEGDIDVVDQTSVYLKVIFTAKDFYAGTLTFKAEDLPDGVTAAFSPDTVDLTGTSAVTVTLTVPVTTANGKTTFKVTATDSTSSKSVTKALNIDRKVIPSVEGPGTGVDVEKGQKVMYTFKVMNKGNLPDSYHIEVTSSNGFEVTKSMYKTATLQPGDSVNVAVTMSVPKDTKEKTDILELKARSTHDGTTVDAASVTTTIKKPATEPGNGPSCGSIITFSVILCIGMVGTVWMRRRK